MSDELDILADYIPKQKEAMPFAKKNNGKVCKLIHDKVLPELDKVEFPDYQYIQLGGYTLDVIRILKEKGWNVNLNKEKGSAIGIYVFAPGLLGKIQATLNMDFGTFLFICVALLFIGLIIIGLFYWTIGTILILAGIGFIACVAAANLS